MNAPVVAPTGVTRRWRPMVTYALIAANVLVYLWTARLAGSLVDNNHSQTFVRYALSPYSLYLDHWDTVLTSGFLHFGPMHLALNMYCLWALGVTAERSLGRSRYLAVYLVSLLGGSAAVLWTQPDALTAGASGAIFGLMGAVLVLILRMKMNPTSLLIVIAVNLVISLTIPGISLWAHLGGLIVGAVATAGIVYLPTLLPPARRTATTVSRLGWVSLTAVAVLVIAAVALRFATFTPARNFPLG
jgi:membrane associated rhomboid family serine protease